jgi:glutamate-1-semialdehyde 2,1-aminomutase
LSGIDRSRLEALLESEEALFRELHPKSIALREEARSSLQDGVPMLWMSRWAGASPVFVKEARGARFVDVDGIETLDLCLGDTGAMTGHAPEPALRALHEQARRGITTMLPTRDAAMVGSELGRRFGLPLWQFTVSATDANRFALRTARLLTGRSKVLVFNGCYHGTVDESYIALDDTGTPVKRASSLGPPVDPLLTSRVVEWNDPDALEAALAEGDVAAVLAEPAMTNIGIILPEPGYLDFLRECTRRHGVYLILDETHTLCAGPGGCTARWGLKPDFVTLGKAIASGLPAGAYGTTREVAQAFAERLAPDDADVGGIGGTLAGNALGLAVMRATLEEVLTPAFHARAESLQERFTAGVEGVIAEFSLPWIVKRLGNRSEYWFQEVAPRNGSEARRGIDHRLDRFMHLWALNRGILMTPFHNMALVSPELTEADIDRHTSVFRGAVEALLGRSPLQEA